MEEWNRKGKILQWKNKKNQKNEDQIEKKIHHKFRLKDEIENKIFFTKGSRKKSEIKRMRTKVKKQHMKN
jgi:hypothetical protein